MPARATSWGGAKTFLAIDDADNKSVLGFYSLSPASLEYAHTPEIVRCGLARHDVPGFRFARLAVPDAACLHRQKLAASCSSSTPRMSDWPDGLLAMGL